MQSISHLAISMTGWSQSAQGSPKGLTAATGKSVELSWHALLVLQDSSSFVGVARMLLTRTLFIYSQAGKF